MHYWEGDTPAAPLDVVPLRDGDPVDLDGYTGATAQLTGPTGVVTPAAAELRDGACWITLPTLTEAGLQLVSIQLQSGAGSERFEAEPIVVEADSGWHSIASARAEWPASAKLDDFQLYGLLQLARNDCEPYAPQLPAGTRPPLHYRAGQLMQARNRLTAGSVDPSTGDTGEGSFAVGPFPLDWHVKQTLRPSRRVPVIR